MPDTEIERMAGDGLEPTPTFVASLREQMRGEWHLGSDVVAPPRLRQWRGVAGLVAAAAAIVGIGLLTQRGADTGSIVGVDSTAPTTSPPATSPTEGLPDSAFEQLWVITSVDGVAVVGSDMPTFTPHGDGTVTGWDGCNQYQLTPEGGESTTAGCPAGVTSVVARGPFVSDSLGVVRTDRFTAMRFERAPDEPAPAYRLDRQYVFGDVGRFALTAGGFVSVESAGCEMAVEVGWSIANGNFMTFLFDSIPDCSQLAPPFLAWLTQMRDVGSTYVFRDSPSPAMWTRVGDRVTRLAFAPEAIATETTG